MAAVPITMSAAQITMSAAPITGKQGAPCRS
jgi:hypothetical protein